MLYRSLVGAGFYKTIPLRCGCVQPQQWSKHTMLHLTLSKAQIAYQDYLHLFAVEEMRPISSSVIVLRRFQNRFSGISCAASPRALHLSMPNLHLRRSIAMCLLCCPMKRWPGVMLASPRPCLVLAWQLPFALSRHTRTAEVLFLSLSNDKLHWVR